MIADVNNNKYQATCCLCGWHGSFSEMPIINQEKECPTCYGHGSEKVEALADYAHGAWSGWMRYLFTKCHPTKPVHQSAGALIIPSEFVKRWKRQMGTLYEDLLEKEKESDRIEAKKMLAIIFGGAE